LNRSSSFTSAPELISHVAAAEDNPAKAACGTLCDNSLRVYFPRVTFPQGFDVYYEALEAFEVRDNINMNHKPSKSIDRAYSSIALTFLLWTASGSHERRCERAARGQAQERADVENTPHSLGEKPLHLQRLLGGLHNVRRSRNPPP
jgi:hypothetical protein